ncbi:tetratricopeptide repeat protein [Nostoc flagelliforme FACHB-838]|uniref:Tetratricopeptide repeat protein n=1 Tax=Nostoc flagelliforme FACHB-838 TaxID=2692904 RepID=A0ABR8DJL9_9NOSO|nr:tetratricopeptide repeat protein [Nostoc flagelliforme]MBD2529667.1 tetratricopeptide repeat protein [Nostoc flagelliforme FACHB-838]
MNSAKTIKLLIKQAKYAENIRNYQEAEVLWLSVIKQKPNDVLAYVRLAKLLSYKNKTEAALTFYQQALLIEPSVQIYTDLGMWLLDIQKPEEAIAAFRQVIALEPNGCTDEYIYRILATALIQQGKLDEALAICYQVIQLNEHLQTCLITGEAIYDKHGFSSVMAVFRQFAAKVQPKPISGIYYRLGKYILFNYSDRNDEAIAAFQEALRLNPGYQHAAQELNKLQHNSHDC